MANAVNPGIPSYGAESKREEFPLATGLELQGL